MKFPRDFFESFPQDPVDLSLLFCKKFELFSPGDIVGVGVSGGKDSMFLLNILTFFRSRFGIKEVICLHFNHGTRGPESDRDEQFVRDTCNELGIRFFCKRAQKELRSEDQMRQERYSFFSDAADELSLTKIATAHNLDDLFETFLINIKRGGGFMSALGIYPVNMNLCNVPVVRPILPVKRKSILEYIKQKNIGYVEDTSNIDIRITRNRLRMILSLLPEDLYNSILSGFFKFWLNLYSISHFLIEIYEKKKEDLPPTIKKQIELYRETGEVKYENLKRSILKKD
ncbi:MAG: tRNA lysidine(34) synthetase TilS [Candidatus Calescibacterium sp.]|nr:tRNA lysidine(34) synthetase TilS [Candidatus Calescibacterium sp.]MCX7734723.1 tRNA lysidine(34) synthetase TilS [bacterium]MDW8087295.1 tRNA lysidine(34) synthetase TilS [Candidatus Calescibacterium sp.]